MIDFELMPHQKDIVFKSDLEPDLFLGWEMGTGKSCATIQCLRRRYADEGRLMRTLILAPLITLKNWKNEFIMFSKVHPKAIHVLDKASKRAAHISSLENRGGVIIMNYDALSQKSVIEAVEKWSPEIIVCDEAHYLKNYKSKRAKSVAKLADKAKHRYMLTGTPILNNALDLFMQFRVMDGYKKRESTFGDNYFVFRGRYFEDENAGWNSKPGHFPKWVPRPSTYEDLHNIISSKMSIVKKEHVLKDLPDLVTEERYVMMTAEQAKAYKDMKEDFVAYLKELDESGKPKAVVAKLAITKSLRLQQIVAGAANTETGWHEFKDTPRMKVLKELLEELTPEHKVIVWACFKANYEMIARLCEEMGIGYRMIHGGIPTKEKYENADAFNNDPDVRVLIGNPGAGGIGINLVASDYSIYYSRNTKLGDSLQSAARNHRKGSEIHDKITHINLVCPGTIDELIADSLDGKLDISEAILEGKNV